MVASFQIHRGGVERKMAQTVGPFDIIITGHKRRCIYNMSKKDTPLFGSLRHQSISSVIVRMLDMAQVLPPMPFLMQLFSVYQVLVLPENNKISTITDTELTSSDASFIELGDGFLSHMTWIKEEE